MLTVSPAASAALAELLEDPEIPQGAAVRLVGGEDATGHAGVGIVVTDEPGPSDEVVHAAGGLEVYVDPSVAGALEDQELDAEVDEGASRIAFRFQRQPLNGGPPGAD